MPRLLKDNINIFNAVDYKVPIIPHKSDFRTTTDRAHSLWLGPAESKVPQVSVPKYCKIYNNRDCKADLKSHNRSTYDWKINTDTSRANLTLCNNRAQFIKGFQEKITQKPPTAINEYQSIHALEYNKKSREIEPKLDRNPICSRLERPLGVTFTNCESAAKYLDPYVSTNMSDFVPYTATAQGGIGKRDNITFWDWIETPKAKGFGLKEPPLKIKMKEQPVYDKEIFKSVTTNRLMPNKLKFVPNAGLTSEFRSNYVSPSPMPFDLDECAIQLVNLAPTNLHTGTTEYSVYNSGKKIHSYIDARVK